jgi:hypothetical protein
MNETHHNHVTSSSSSNGTGHQWGACPSDSYTSDAHACPSRSEVKRRAAESAAKFGSPNSPQHADDIHRDTNYDFELAMIEQSSWFLSQIEMALTLRCVPAQLW